MRQPLARTLGWVWGCILLTALILFSAVEPHGAARQLNVLNPLPSPLIADPKPVRSCASLVSFKLPNTVVKSAALVEAAKTAPAHCLVTAVVAHPTGDEITVWVGLPNERWNGRFHGSGGAAFTGGHVNNVGRFVSQGYAVASTDSGHATPTGSFALDSAGRLNWHLIRDYAQNGIHEMTLVGKALVDAYFGQPARRSYFEGCSTGGRQALMEAQRFPNDYDGIVAGAPNISLPQLLVAHLWPSVLAQEASYLPANCKLTAATTAAIQACDKTDGLKDGIVNDPRTCMFDARSLIGTSVDGCATFTDADASFVNAIWEGPRRRNGAFMWHGLERGTFLGDMVDEERRALRMNGMARDWWRFFLLQDPQADLSRISRDAYEQYFEQSIDQYRAVIGTDDPNLSAFRDRGGKLLLWHGWSDPSIPARGTIDYVNAVEAHMGGAIPTSEFARLFLAPGVYHCGGGNGFHPEGRMAAIIEWVEQGIAPQMLPGVEWEGNKLTGTRPVCPYPKTPRYRGTGSLNEAANFECN